MAKNVGNGFGSDPGKRNSILGNPGAQGSVSFGGSFKQETSNTKGNKLGLSQTIANPGKGPVRNNGNAKGSPSCGFGLKGVKKPQPAKNRVGFTTSD